MVQYSTASTQGRYAVMEFPKYAYKEYPKILKFGKKKVIVKDRAEEFDAKLKNAEAIGSTDLAKDKNELAMLQRETGHIEEKQALFRQNNELAAEMQQLKQELARLKSIRQDPGDHDDGRKNAGFEGGDNKTEKPVGVLGSGLTVPPKTGSISAKSEASLTSPTGKANDGAVETHGTAPATGHADSTTKP